MSEPSSISQSDNCAAGTGQESLFRALRRRIYHRHRSIWFERSLDDTLSLIKPRFDGRIDYENPDDVVRWLNDRNIPGTNDPIEGASIRRRGQLMAGVYDGDEMIGYVKIGWDKVYVLDYRIDLTLPADAFFVLDAYLIPLVRGNGGGPFLVSATSLEMKRRGFKRRISHVRADNVPMLKSGARGGYKEIGRVDYMSVLGWKIFRPHPSTFLDYSDIK